MEYFYFGDLEIWKTNRTFWKKATFTSYCAKIFFIVCTNDPGYFLFLLFSIHPMLFGFQLWYDIYIIFFWIYRNSVSFIKLSPKLMSILHTCKRVTYEFSLTSFLLVSVSQIVTRVIHKQHHIKDTVKSRVKSRKFYKRE